MALRRQTFRIIVAAIPILLLSAVAIFVMLRFLAVRDQLGKWDFSLMDRDGIIGSHGELDLVADGWTVDWTSTYPWITFTPTLSALAGILIFDGNAASRYGDRAILVRPHIIPSQGIFCWLIEDDLHRHDSILIDFEDQPHGGGPMSGSPRVAIARFR